MTPTPSILQTIAIDDRLIAMRKNLVATRDNLENLRAA
jgi:hypothetical protein